MSWDVLAAEIRGCAACPELAAARTHVVVGDAPPGARLLLVGEAPGAQEDESGRPFIGRAGQLLDGVLAEAGLARADVAVVNILKCRPPENRRPKPVEIAACTPWRERQTALIGPELVVGMGTTAVKALLTTMPTLASVRGRIHQRDGRRIIATYHPSAALRFGPKGAPMAALRADLQWAASLL